jgi:phosphoribosylanthranilate isomerase
MWIKICGLTTPEAVTAAVEARVHAIGFVFAESVRRVAPEQAARLAEPARGRVQCVAVTRHPSQADVDEVCRVFRPDVLQTDAADLATLRLPAGIAALPVWRAGADLPQRLPPRVLFEGPVSGTGTTADWSQARELARRTRVVLAGGLRPENVIEAIRSVAPWGVDVSSGVEARPGIKDPARIHEFVRAARAGFAGVDLKETAKW